VSKNNAHRDYCDGQYLYQLDNGPSDLEVADMGTVVPIRQQRA
jgi:hypothetical protein